MKATQNVSRRIISLFLLLVMCLCVAPAVFAEEEMEIEASQMLELMEKASKLNEEDYTSSSWETLETAISVAQKALIAQDQYLADAATSLLSSALEGLQSREYDALEEALQDVTDWTEDQDIKDLWSRLLELDAASREAKTSGNQEAADQFTEEIDQILDQIDQKCNVKKKVIPWAVMLALSLLANLGFVALIIIRTRNIKKYQRDDVPLVEYDIDDDIL